MSAPLTLPGLLYRAVAAWGDRIALIADDERLTYSDLAARTDRYARALVALGAGRGTPVGLLMENSTDWVALAFAVAGLGALLVPVSTFSTTDDLAYQLRHADVEILLMSAGFLGHDYLGDLGSVLPELATTSPGALRSAALPALQRVVVRGPAVLPAGCDPWHAMDTARDAVPIEVVRGLAAEVDPGDDCYLLYTSGTTARPKGVVLTHGAVAGNGQHIGDFQGLVPDDVVWHHFPLFFSAGCCNVLLGTLSHGAALILQPGFEPAAALEVIERERATTWHLWPHVLKALLEHPDWGRRDHSVLHKGTGPYDLVIRQTAGDGLGGVNMYGMTETATAFSCTRAEDPPSVRLRTQGTLLPGNAVAIVDPDTGRPVAPGGQGEICVKGPSLLRRYHEVDPATTFDADGFFHTGDLGFVDDDGRLHFEHRLKDVIKTAGVNVSPAEVEEVIARLDGVDAAYVFPLPSDDRGEDVGAAVVPAAGCQIDEATVVAHCRDVLPGYKRPVAVLVTGADEVPMTATGKVQKFALRDRLLARLDRLDRNRAPR